MNESNKILKNRYENLKEEYIRLLDVHVKLLNNVRKLYEKYNNYPRPTKGA